jgi:uncharacterized protein
MHASSDRISKAAQSGFGLGGHVSRLTSHVSRLMSPLMKIWIDADACPRVIKEIVFRASERLQVPVCLVANKDLSKSHAGLVTSVVVTEGFDVADDYIVQQAAPEDLVITADIPLAARIVAKGGVALDPRGELYTEENVGERLSVRDLMQELRAAGAVQGGPAQFGLTDRKRFASALDSLLTRKLKGRRPEKR